MVQKTIKFLNHDNPDENGNSQEEEIPVSDDYFCLIQEIRALTTAIKRLK